MIPVLVVDARRELRLRRSARRAAYYCAAVAALAEVMHEAGTRLVIQRGPYITTVRRLARRTYSDTVVWSAGYDADTKRADRDLQSALEEPQLQAATARRVPTQLVNERCLVRQNTAVMPRASHEKAKRYAYSYAEAEGTSALQSN